MVNLSSALKLTFPLFVIKITRHKVIDHLKIGLNLLSSHFMQGRNVNAEIKGSSRQ
jgi:hypothetical protein